MAFIQEDDIYSLINVKGGTCLSGGKAPPLPPSARGPVSIPSTFIFLSLHLALVGLYQFSRAVSQSLGKSTTIKTFKRYVSLVAAVK